MVLFRNHVHVRYFDGLGHAVNIPVNTPPDRARAGRLDLMRSIAALLTSERPAAPNTAAVGESDAPTEETEAAVGESEASTLLYPRQPLAKAMPRQTLLHPRFAGGLARWRSVIRGASNVAEGSMENELR